MGTQILPKGNWFMYNTFNVNTTPSGECYGLQAGNPKNGANIVGEYCINPLLGNQYVATYDFDDTVTIGGFEYKIVVLKEHLAISDTMTFTGIPGTDDNQDFGVPFTDLNGQFYVFAHFSIGFE